MLLGNLTDQHSVVSSTAVLKKDGEDFPDVGDHRVFLLSVLQARLDQFVETDGVDEK